jgi:hypothetical protein
MRYYRKVKVVIKTVHTAQVTINTTEHFLNFKIKNMEHKEVLQASLAYLEERFKQTDDPTVRAEILAAMAEIRLQLATDPLCR